LDVTNSINLSTLEERNSKIEFTGKRNAYENERKYIIDDFS
jgi:hypothetical protein